MVPPSCADSREGKSTADIVRVFGFRVTCALCTVISSNFLPSLLIFMP